MTHSKYKKDSGATSPATIGGKTWYKYSIKKAGIVVAQHAAKYKRAAKCTAGQYGTRRTAKKGDIKNPYAV